MRRTNPDLVGRRKIIYRTASDGLLAVFILYVLWTNYVVFVGGNLPLTPISLGSGSVGAGLSMLFLGDLFFVIALWFLVGGVVLNLLDKVLRVGSRSYATVPSQSEQRPNQQPAQPQQWQQPQWQRQQQQEQQQQRQQQPIGEQPSSPTLVAPPGSWPPPPQ